MKYKTFKSDVFTFTQNDVWEIATRSASVRIG
jgi:hypothetical protein